MRQLNRAKRAIVRWVQSIRLRMLGETVEALTKQLQKNKKMLDAERAMHMEQRQWNLEMERDAEAREKMIEELKARAPDPLCEAKRLLALIDEVLTPIWCHSGTPLNGYELKCWQADYRDFKRNMAGPR